MSLFKMGMIGAVLATGLVGGASKARADVRFDIGPARVDFVAPRIVTAPPVYASVDYGRYGYGRVDWRRRGLRWQRPARFAAEIRAEMNQADADIRYHVEQGTVSPQALASLEADRQEIERDLVEAMSKGYITPDDRMHLEGHVQEIRDLRDRYRVIAPYGQTGYWQTGYHDGERDGDE